MFTTAEVLCGGRLQVTTNVWKETIWECQHHPQVSGKRPLSLYPSLSWETPPSLQAALVASKALPDQHQFYMPDPGVEGDSPCGYWEGMGDKLQPKGAVMIGKPHTGGPEPFPESAGK